MFSNIACKNVSQKIDKRFATCLEQRCTSLSLFHTNAHTLTDTQTDTQTDTEKHTYTKVHTHKQKHTLSVSLSFFVNLNLPFGFCQSNVFILAIRNFK
jgi:hypothetical protein